MKLDIHSSGIKFSNVLCSSASVLAADIYQTLDLTDEELKRVMDEINGVPLEEPGCWFHNWVQVPLFTSNDEYCKACGIKKS